MIQSSVSVGKVVFRPITRTLFDKWVAKLIDLRADDERTDFARAMDSERAKVQGLAAGTLVLNAEKQRAGQLALHEVERMLNLLRFFEPVNLHPSLLSHCAIFGKENMQSTLYYIVENDMLSGSTAAAVDKAYQPWKLEDGYIAAIRGSGLDVLNSILLREKKTPFHTTILDALQIYSRAGVSGQFSDKLLYLLVTLESLLLKDGSEAIQQNVGERLAFALSRNARARKDIAANFKDVYSLRSKFLHHGNDVDSQHLETLRIFMSNVWKLLSLIIVRADTFENREKFIEALDNVKFS